METYAIDTERLRIVALTPEQLRLLAEDILSLEKTMKICYRAEKCEGIFKKIVKSSIQLCEENPEKYFWRTFWLIIRKSDNVAIGSIDFKNLPDENGNVEIGYGLTKEFENNGYMTEAVGAFSAWGKSQKGVTAIIAETDLNNFASQKVLKKCGFKEISRSNLIFWSL